LNHFKLKAYLPQPTVNLRHICTSVVWHLHTLLPYSEVELLTSHVDTVFYDVLNNRVTLVLIKSRECSQLFFLCPSNLLRYNFFWRLNSAAVFLTFKIPVWRRFFGLMMLSFLFYLINVRKGKQFDLLFFSFFLV
jgi:hypothetical protein